jgi:hypothetical protein
MTARENADIRSYCANQVCSKERKNSMRICLMECYQAKKLLPSNKVLPQIRHAASLRRHVTPVAKKVVHPAPKRSNAMFPMQRLMEQMRARSKKSQ